MVEPKQAESEVAKQIGVMWDEAKAELSRLREMVERAVTMGDAQASLAKARGEREAAFARLGEGLYKLVEGGELAVPAALKRLVGEVKAKDAELLRQQADIAAILKEADALAEKGKRQAAAKKKR